MIERTLAIIKPDGVAKGATAEIIARYTRAGLCVVDSREVRMTADDVRQFYAAHVDRPFFPELITAMTAGPMVIVMLEGEDAVRRVRELNGATDPAKAAPGTIRCDFKGEGGPYNVVHGSDSLGAAMHEIALFFATTS